jgi:hypothetical protein
MTARMGSFVVTVFNRAYSQLYIVVPTFLGLGVISVMHLLC